jgi:hypothetical protein
VTERRSRDPRTDWATQWRRHWDGAEGAEPADASGWPWGTGRPFPWLGVVLVLLGVGLLVRELLPAITVLGLVLLALGLAFAAAWLLRGARWAMVPALLLLALAAARLLGDLGLLRGEGWTPLLLGASLLAIWLLGRRGKAGHNWALWLGVILVLVGLTQVSDELPGVPDLSPAWPVVLIAAGAVLIAVSAMRRSRTR